MSTTQQSRSRKSRSSSPSRKSTSSGRSGSRSSRDAKQTSSQADRYQRAADDALQQLDWAIGYLHGIGKTQISRALARNRSYIREHLMGEAEQPLPGQQTNET